MVNNVPIGSKWKAKVTTYAMYQDVNGVGVAVIYQDEVVEVIKDCGTHVVVSNNSLEDGGIRVGNKKLFKPQFLELFIQQELK